jgi:hypothetical protein
MGRGCSTIRRKGIHIGFRWESEKERDHQEVLDVGVKIILRRISKS